MGKSVIDVVQDLFGCNTLLVAANYALVTLIPNTAKAKMIKDMHPIACCNTIYKVILKILIAQLSRVIHEVMDNSQSAFISGRLIHDNIILAHELIRGMEGSIYHLVVPFKWMYKKPTTRWNGRP